MGPTATSLPVREMTGTTADTANKAIKGDRPQIMGGYVHHPHPDRTTGRDNMGRTISKKRTMKRITVLCGSSTGFDPLYTDHAHAVGRSLADHGIGLVHGGAVTGLLGAVATGVLEGGGEVIGVLPSFPGDAGTAHDGLSELVLVKTMHQQKARMDELSDGVLTLPGGYGTLEEFFERLAREQPAPHRKPVALLNINGFYDYLLALLDQMAENGLLNEASRDMLIVGSQIGEVLGKMLDHQPSQAGNWTGV